MRLTVSSFEDVLDIRVWNDGRGIPEQELPRVFEPFVRNGSHGSGLGLWVTYQIVHQLHGEILVTSSEGDTCFTVRVPLMEAA